MMNIIKTAGIKEAVIIGGSALAVGAAVFGGTKVAKKLKNDGVKIPGIGIAKKEPKEKKEKNQK